MKREEAIKEMREKLPWLTEDTKRLVEALIPELAESEDEKVRKWLLDHAIEMIAGLESDISLSTYDGIKGHDPEAEAELAQWRKAIAYLEKQKEQKDYRKLYEDIAKSKWFKRAYEGKSLGELASSAAWKDEQKEQESAERIEDSVKFEEGFKTGRESGLRDGQKYVLNNLDSYGLCKPAEWSEDDEDNLHRVIRVLEDNDSDWKELSDWLKSLRPQPRQEWSDGDEKQIAQIERIVKNAGCTKMLQEKIHNWFKSLRPSWKPTEKMLEALKWAKCEFHPDCPETMEQLQYLYTELKKIYYDWN